LLCLRIRLDDSEHIPGWILRVREPTYLRDRHFRNADFAVALLDLLDGLIERRNRDGETAMVFRVPELCPSRGRVIPPLIPGSLSSPVVASQYSMWRLLNFSSF